MQHIAREGETEYAVILRAKSGLDAGHIDFALLCGRVAQLCKEDQQDIVDTAETLLKTIKFYCRKLECD